ncbi:MAG: hypothetical protein HY062_12365, partial [Bacteroidetes bacterium]|nr:hypothetical protein [Bacteroidota bacterium]
MKKIILFSLLCLPLFFLAQTDEQEIARKIKSNNLPAKKATVVAGSKQYDVLKAEGKLSDFEVVANTTSLKPINKKTPFTVGKQVQVTPCEFPPMVGNPAFPMPSPSTSVNDDETATIALPFNFCFYGVSYNSVNVFDNGNVQFNTNSTGYTSTGFPSNSVNMIAPFWADGTADVIKGGVHYGKVLVDIHPSYVVITWDSLPYYQGGTVTSFTNTTLLNTFQLVLTNGTDPILPVGKNVGFYYRKMQWTTGNASTGSIGFPQTQPGNPATVGANEGNGVDFFQMGRFGIPGNAYDGP